MAFSLSLDHTDQNRIILKNYLIIPATISITLLGLAACSSGTIDLFDQSGKVIGKVDCKTEKVQVARGLPVSEVTDADQWYLVAELQQITQAVTQEFSGLVVDAYSSAVDKACR